MSESRHQVFTATHCEDGPGTIEEVLVVDLSQKLPQVARCDAVCVCVWGWVCEGEVV